MSHSGSVLVTMVPHQSPPNAVIADRFEAWKGVLGNLRKHFASISAAEASHNRELRKVTESVPHPFSTYELFEKGGSVQGLGNLLYEQMSGRVAYSDQILSALDTEIIPELASAEETLKEKISQIRGLTHDFDNELASGLETSRKSLAALQEAITDWEVKKGAVSSDKDPFIVDLAARKHLRQSLSEENYLRDTTLNLEESASQLETLVVGAIKRALAKYNESVSREAAELANMSQKVEQSILAGHLDTEWSFFVKKQYQEGALVDPSTAPRSLETTGYSGKDHLSTSPICDGWLEKKSKYLNNYTTAFYIISPSRFLHEFRSNDLRVETQPAFSLYLPECEIGKTSSQTDSVHKFVLKGKQVGSGLHQEHNWTFRAKSREDMLAWYANIGRASDRTFQFTSAPLQTTDAAEAKGLSRNSTINTQNAPAAAILPTLDLEHDEADLAPFRGPETVAISSPATKRPAAGRFNTGGFDSPWSAVAASLHAQPMTPRRDSDLGRLATTSYGSRSGSVPGTPVTYPEHDEHLRQASVNSSAAHFLDREILDDNAYLEYDQQHGTHSTLVGDENFKPACPETSRDSASNNGEKFRPRRSSSLAFREVAGSPAAAEAPAHSRRPRPSKVPSRKPTATYGDLSNLPLPSMMEVNEATTPEPSAEPYVSPYFPAPGAGTTGALPASQFQASSPSAQPSVGVFTVQPQRSSTLNSGANTPTSHGQLRAPVRKMSLSEQIMVGGHSTGTGPESGFSTSQRDETLRDLEPNDHATVGTHDDLSSPYPVSQRFRVPRSRQASMSATPELQAEPLEAYDVAPHMRVGTQSNEARYKVGSHRGSRTASQIATPQESLDAGTFNRSALDTLSADTLASKLSEPSTGEKARARRTPSRGASIDLGDSTGSPASPAFNVNQRHAFRKPPSRGSSLSLGGSIGGAGDVHNLLNTISEAFEKDLAAAKGNQPGDHHISGEFPKTPAPDASRQL